MKKVKIFSKLNYFLIPFALLVFGSTIAAAPNNPVKPVQVEKAVFSTWQNRISLIGTLHAPASIDLIVEVGGKVTSLNFTPGSKVKKGDLLAVIDPALAEEELKRSKANEALALAQFQRSKSLSKNNFLDQSGLDQARAAWESAVALREESAIALANHFIKAPFDGRIGLNRANIGQYLAPGFSIASLEKEGNLILEFSLPSKFYYQIEKSNSLLRVETSDGRAFHARLIALDSRADEETRSVLARAELLGRPTEILPGDYAKVFLMVGKSRQVLTVPRSALFSEGGISSLFLVDKNNKVLQKTVRIGDIIDNERVIIEKGLQEGDQVIVNGQLQVSNGMAVQIQPAKLIKNK